MQFYDSRLKIGVLGGDGLLGADLVRFISINHEVDSITRKNYREKKGSHYKVFINASGNSKRFWANKNPQNDFLASTVSVNESIFDFSSDLYIYISSPDVYENHTKSRYAKEEKVIDYKNLKPYGFHKYLGELIVRKYTKKFLILRSSMILGKNLKKGPFYDIKKNKPLFITSTSRLQLITTHAIADIIETLLGNFIVNETINVGGIGTFSFANTKRYFKKKFKIDPKAQTQIYEMSIEKLRQLYPRLKTSEEYLQEFLQDYSYIK